MKALKSPRRLARVVVAGLVIGLGVANLYWSVAQWTLSDAGAYWQAAIRLREGAELYPAVTNIEASDVYRYAPWFAWLAAPFTFLPVQVAGAIWSLVLVVGSVAAVVPLARHQAWLQVAFFFPILIGISAVGNVHALMVAWLVWGVERRSGPLWIALAASLKAVPIFLVLVYLGRRQWRRAVATLAFTAILVAPAFLYDLSEYVTSSGQAGNLVQLPLVYGAIVAVACTLAVLTARRPYGWLAGSVAVTLATPRLFVYDVTYLLVGPVRARAGRAAEGGRADGGRHALSERRQEEGPPPSIKAAIAGATAQETREQDRHKSACRPGR